MYIHIHIYEQGHLGLKLVVKFSKDVFFKKHRAKFLCILKPPPRSNTVRNELPNFVFNFFPCNVTWFLATNLSCYSWFCQFACLWGFGPADPAHLKRLPAVLLSALTLSNRMCSHIDGSGS